MGQIRVKATGAFCLSEPGGAVVDQQPTQVADSAFWRQKIREGLAAEVPVGEFLTETRKMARQNKNKMAHEEENKAVS